ncbi:hypothetical protein SRABI04_01512 [Chryseobacterium sp. Bi04]|nr:hypothetical protein SRABI04_01512 [Chryseobacterium sp. Bi04]
MYQYNSVSIISMINIVALGKYYLATLLKKHDKNLFFTNCGFMKNHYICTKKKFSNGKPN